MDTGAVIAVFNKGHKLFNVWSRGVNDVTAVREVIIHGFGGSGSKDIIYNLPTFVFFRWKKRYTLHEYENSCYS